MKEGSTQQSSRNMKEGSAASSAPSPLSRAEDAQGTPTQSEGFSHSAPRTPPAHAGEDAPGTPTHAPPAHDTGVPRSHAHAETGLQGYLPAHGSAGRGHGSQSCEGGGLGHGTQSESDAHRRVMHGTQSESAHASSAAEERWCHSHTLTPSTPEPCSLIPKCALILKP